MSVFAGAGGNGGVWEEWPSLGSRREGLHNENQNPWVEQKPCEAALKAGEQQYLCAPPLGIL